MTNGPWKWDRALNYVTDARGDIVCEDIASTHPRGHVYHTSKSDANARLIAAAPELLTVLQRVTEYAEECASDRDERPSCIEDARQLLKQLAVQS